MSEANQCDGCRRGLLVDDMQIHREDDGSPYMVCDSSLYANAPARRMTMKKTIVEPKARPSAGCTALLACPFCGAIPELLDNTLSVWVPHSDECFVTTKTMTPNQQRKWNHRQPNATAHRASGEADGCDFCRYNHCACDENKHDGEMR